MSDARPWVRGGLPWLRSGPLHRVHTDASEELDSFIERSHYRRIDLDGRAMTSRDAAHAELKRAFDLPAWCGANWDAFDDCFGHFVAANNGALLAVVWNDLDASVAAAPATAVEVGWALLECAFGRMPSLNPPVRWSVTMEVFATGSGEDFDRPALDA